MRLLAGRPVAFRIASLSIVAMIALVAGAYVLASRVAPHLASARLPAGPADRFVRGTLCPPEPEPSTFRLHGTRRWGNGDTLLIYTAQCTRGAEPMPRPTLGFMLVHRGRFGWEEVQRGLAVEPAQRERYDDLLDFEKTSSVRGDWAWVQGTVRSPERVAAVEAVFDNGEVARDEAHGGHYALISRNTRGPSELRALDRRGRVIDRYSIWGGGEGLPPLPMEELDEGWSGIIGGVSLATLESCDKVLDLGGPEDQ